MTVWHSLRVAAAVAAIIGFFWLVENVNALDCSKPITPGVVNGKRINCEIIGSQELSTIQCDPGYEFKPNIPVLIIQTLDGVTIFPLTCHPIGCPKSQMPSTSELEMSSKYNMLLVRIECVPHVSLADSLCQPDVSYLDLECKPGYELDTRFSSKRITCSRADNSWSQTPVCIDIKQNTTTTTLKPPTTTVLSATTNILTTLKPPTTSTQSATNVSSLVTTTTAAQAADQYTTTNIDQSITPITSSGAHLITLNTLTAAVVYTFPTSGLPCPNTFHLPANYNESAMVFHIRKEPHAAYAHLNYHTGSYIIFPCLGGYKSSNPDGSPLVMNCQPDGQWSKIGSCVVADPSKTTPDDDDDDYYYDEDYDAPTTTSTKTTTTTTTEALLTFSLNPNGGKSCPNVFRLPANYNKTLTKYHTKREHGTQTYYPGSYIVFACATGFKVFSSLPLYTYCQSDGEWSEVADCDDESAIPETTTTPSIIVDPPIPCPGTFPVPENYNPDATEYKVSRVKGTNTYNADSWISFTCLTGYVPKSSTSRLVTYCQSNGKWSQVDDCVSLATTSTPPKQKSCLINSLPRPANINESRTVSELRRDELEPTTRFKAGSWIKYECKEFYSQYPVNKSLMSVCSGESGEWSPVGTCKIHPCWERLPRRPLNGRREVELVYNPKTGSVKGTHVNFTCNSYYEIKRGRERVFCNNGVWDSEWPVECVLTLPLCTREPARFHAQNNIALKTLNRVQFRREFDYERSEQVTSITQASYVCNKGGYSFADTSNTNYRYINGMFYIYKNVTCVGNDMWSPMPVCVKN